MAGYFISLDGIDGCGKSTQSRMLVEWLIRRDLKAIPCADPGSTAVGHELRQLLLSWKEQMSIRCEALLFMASRAQLVDQVIRPELEQGTIVVSDRYLLANVVYQGHAGGMSPREVWEIGQWSCGGILPDLTLVLDLPPEVARERREGPADRLESRQAEYHRQVRKGFLTEAEQAPDQIKVIDALQSIDAIHEAICAEVLLALEAGSRS